MFSRSGSYIFNSLKSEVKKSGVRYTAQSKKKRIDVQLLKDFPGLGVKGQIVHVKPSTMINKLHLGNGAIYLNYDGAKPIIPVVHPKKVEFKPSLPKEVDVSETEVSTEQVDKQKNEYNADDLLSLDQLVKIDLAELIDTDKDAIFSKIPKRLTFLKDLTNENELLKPITPSRIRSALEKVVVRALKGNQLKDSVPQLFASKTLSFSIKKSPSEPKKDAEIIEQITIPGTYSLSVLENGKQIASSTIKVNSRN